MKKIINGRKYDTETAEKIARIDCNDGNQGNFIYCNDFDFWDMVLYRKKTGEYFIESDGCYADPSGFPEPDSDPVKMLPISEKQAKKFVENSDEDYEAIFGEVEE